jgi:hypothetical protein
MDRTLGSELYIRYVERKGSGQRGFSAHVLGLLVISLAMVAVPVSAPAGEPSTFWTSRVDIPASATRVDDPANGAWSLAEAEYRAAKYGADPVAGALRSEALTQSHRGQSVDDPANAAWSLAEAEYYAAKYGADLVASTSRSEALARSHRGQPVDDPAIGAWSLAEAAYYVAKYRAEGVNTVTLVNDAGMPFGDAATKMNRP